MTRSYVSHDSSPRRAIREGLLSHVTHFEWVMSHTLNNWWVSVMWLISMCVCSCACVYVRASDECACVYVRASDEGVTRGCVWHDFYVRHDPLVHVTWHICMCDVILQCVCIDHNVNMGFTWIWEYGIDVSTSWGNACVVVCVCMCGPQKGDSLEAMCDMSHSHVSHDMFIHTQKLTIKKNAFESCLTYKCVTWHIYMSHVSHINVSHDTFIRETWLIHMCDTTIQYAYVWHDFTVCVYVCMCVCVCVCVPWTGNSRGVVCDTWLMWLSHTCDMTRCVTWLSHTCDMTDSYVSHDWVICVTWLIHVCLVTQSYVCHDSFICVTCLVSTCVCVMCVCMCVSRRVSQGRGCWVMSQTLNMSRLTHEWAVSHIYMSQEVVSHI